MSWLRYSDDFFLEDPAVMALGEDEAAGILAYVRAVGYAAKHLTDGEIPAGFLRREDPAGVAALSRVCLLELRTDGSGFLPRFLEVRDDQGRVTAGHHPSKAVVEDRRSKRAEAGKAGGIASGEARSQATRQQDAKQVAGHVAKQDANPVSRTPVNPVNPGSPILSPAPARESDDLKILRPFFEERGLKVPSNGLAEQLLGLVTLKGPVRVLEAMRATPTDATFRDVVFRVEDALREATPKPGPGSSDPREERKARLTRLAGIGAIGKPEVGRLLDDSDVDLDDIEANSWPGKAFGEPRPAPLAVGST